MSVSTPPAVTKASAVKKNYSENVNASPYITIGKGFKVKRGIYNVLTRNISCCVNTMLFGPTGVGKTELISNIATEMGLPITILDMGTMSDPIMSMVGMHVMELKDGKTVSEFKKSRFSEVIQHPGIVLLDELNRASLTANNLLFPCLDFRRELLMEYSFRDTRPIKIHEKCMFIATSNIGSQYTGTHKLDRALMDRFMIVEIDPLDVEATKDVIRFNNPRLTGFTVDKLVEIYFKINALSDSYEINFTLSIRHLKMVADMISDGFTPYDAFYVICKGLGSTPGLKAIESVLGTAKINTNGKEEVI